MEAIKMGAETIQELGFYGINLPEKYGRQDVSLKGLCMFKEELARSGAVLWGRL